MLTAIENVMVPMRLDGTPLSDARERAMKALASVVMEGKEKNRPGELSGGEAQRVAIARALVMSPAIVLADEPTGALDSLNGERVIELFRSLVAQSQQTLVIVTHDAGVAAAAERIVKMRDGRVVNDSTASSTVQSKALATN
jgi:putative ABC transport system ATP-binding protein